MKNWKWPQWVMFISLITSGLLTLRPDSMIHPYWLTQSIDEHNAWVLVDVFFFAFILSVGGFWKKD